MYRGTTPSIVFNVNPDFDLSKVVEVWVTLKNSINEKTFTISEVEVEAEEHTLTIMLTQEDTLAFKILDTCEAQIRFLDEDGLAYASNIVTLNIGRILKEGVIE